jgi:hypothetical protein
VIALATHEMLASSNAEQIIRAVMIESTVLALDSALFGNAAGTTDRPPGLLNGIGATTPSASTILTDALVEDLSKLGGAVDTVLDAAYHSDTVPLDIVSGSPVAVAAPVPSLFQQDEVGLRMRMFCAWALRSSGAIAYMQNVVW